MTRAILPALTLSRLALCQATAARAQEACRACLDTCLKTTWEAGDTGTSCIGRSAHQSSERSASASTHGELASLRNEAASWDEMHNAEYAALVRAVGKAHAEKIREAQRRWLRGQRPIVRF